MQVNIPQTQSSIKKNSEYIIYFRYNNRHYQHYINHCNQDGGVGPPVLGQVLSLPAKFVILIFRAVSVCIHNTLFVANILLFSPNANGVG